MNITLRIFIYTCLLCMPAYTQAQREHFQFGGRAWGMGNASLTLRDEWAVWNNPGAMGGISRAAAFFGYDTRFGITAFQTYGAGVVAPVRVGVAGLSLSRFGDELYSEQRVGLAWAYQVDMVSIGAKVNYLQTRIQDLGSRGAIVLELGGVMRFTKELTFAMYAYNLGATQMRSDFGEDEPVPVVLRAGAAYTPFASLKVNVEIEKNLDYQENLRAGLEYELIKGFYLRTGIQSYPATQHVGVGFHPRKLRFDYALSSLGRLGLAHQISLSIPFGKTQTDNKQ